MSCVWVTSSPGPGHPLTPAPQLGGLLASCWVTASGRAVPSHRVEKSSARKFAPPGPSARPKSATLAMFKMQRRAGCSPRGGADVRTAARPRLRPPGLPRRSAGPQGAPARVRTYRAATAVSCACEHFLNGKLVGPFYRRDEQSSSGWSRATPPGNVYPR
jgi:hypothetical protein